MSEFRSVEKRYFDWKWQSDPTAASAVGLTEFDGKYGDSTLDGVHRDLLALRVFDRTLTNMAITKEDEAIDRQALLSEVQTAIHSIQTEQPHKRNPAFWVEHALCGIDVLIHDQRPPEALLGRLRAIPQLLEDARHTLTHPVELFAQVGQDSVTGGITLLEKVKALSPLLTTDAQTAIEALTAFGGDMKQWVENGSPHFAIGKDSYNWYLQHHYLLSYDVTELWQYGREMKDAMETKLKLAAMYLGGSRDWGAVADKLRDNYPKPNELLSVYQEKMKQARTFVEENRLVTMLDIPLEVEATPTYLAPTCPFAAYSPPAMFLPKKKGTLYVTVNKEKEKLRDHCIYEIPITALHEGYPGHHLQHTIAQSLASRTRNLVSSDLMVEGWALYCESMMGERGFYESPEEMFFQHVHALWRACRVLLDVGLQTKGVSVQGATNFLQNTMHISRASASAEVKRYATEPTQPMTYAIGRREIMKLRSDWVEAHKTDLREFHDTLLQYGGFPIALSRKGMGL